MLLDFASTTGREIKWINVFRSAEALEQLLDGNADISIGAVPIDNRRDPLLLSSEPIGLRRFSVIGQQQMNVESPLDLVGLSVAVKLSSPMWPYLDRLRSALGDLRLQVLPDDLSREEVLQKVSDGFYDAALISSEVGERAIANFPRTKYLFDLTGPQPMSWYARADRQSLIDELNVFISSFHNAYQGPEARLRSFADVKAQGRLRVITRLDGVNYFVQSGRPAGFELGLARRFAKIHGLRLDVLVARDDEQLVQWLRDGVGDIVTARVNAKQIHGEPTFRMSREYRHEASLLITRRTTKLSSKAALAGANLAAFEGSRNVEALEDFAPQSHVIRVSPSVSLAQLMTHIENDLIDGAIINARNLRAILREHPQLRAGISIPNPYKHRWTIRASDSSMASAVDEFLHDEYRQASYNVLERQYVRSHLDQRDDFADISPFDDLLRDYSDRYGFDWRLIAAQMYQESHFDPHAISAAGALGLMQLMPATAQSLGVDNPHDPEAGIHAGVKYLDRLRNRFDAHIPMSERTWFALAAYNIGYDRVRRSRNQARASGLDPDKWFGNVEVAMRELAQKQTMGGCPCGQAIVYVRSIRSLYYAYRNVQLAARDVPSQNRKLRPARANRIKPRTASAG